MLMRAWTDVKLSINQQVSGRFDRWLSTRIPRASSHQLTRNNIFIFPTTFGFVYLLFVLLLFLLATNYQNNLIMLLSLLLGSLFISSMLQSFFNLSGLTVACYSPAKGFANEAIALAFTVDAANPRFALNFSFDHQHNCYVNNTGSGHMTVQVPFCSAKRGVIQPGRLKISSEYALGFFTTWTRLEFAQSIIVYPKPKPGKSAQIIAAHVATDNGKNAQYRPGGEDFYELKTFRVGEPLTQVAWKQVAKGQGWFSKSNQQLSEQNQWLMLHDMPGNIEQKLQFLCYLILDYERSGKAFGVDLGNDARIAPGSGVKHLQQCLLLLAQYPPAAL